MNDVSLNPEIIELEAQLELEMPQYPVIPNPDGEATADISKMEIDNVIYNVKDAEARAVLPTKVDKENGKGLSTNDYTNEDKAIVGGVTAELATKVDKEAGKGLSTEDYTTEEKSKLFHIQAGAEVNVQADWFESNKYNDAYIKNKPINLSAFNNDVGFVQNTVNNLVNYYTKTQTYTKEEVNALVQPFAQFEVVDVLPTEDISLTTIYLVPKNPAQTDNIYDEYINTDGTSSGWEKIGDTEVDLSNYYTKSEVDTLLSAKANSADLATVATSGSYNDLTGTPTLATVATSGSYNDLTDKPNLSTVATSGDYDDLTNKPVIDTEISPTSTNAVQNKVIYDLLNDLLPEATATGNPISITNASGLNAKSLKVELEPIQDTSGGEPSPEHICPISGRTQTVVSVNSEDTTIPFNQTVYGGEVDVTSGGTSDKFGLVDLGTINWVQTTAGGHTVYRTEAGAIPLKNYGNTRTTQGLCSGYKVDTTAANGTGFFYTQSFYVRNDNFIDETDCKNSMHGIMLCYELATPTTISTPSNEISLLKGNNTFVADGDMELVYSKTPQ